MNTLSNRNKTTQIANEILVPKMCHMLIESQKYLLFFKLRRQLVLLIHALKLNFTSSQRFGLVDF